MGRSCAGLPAGWVRGGGEGRGGGGGVKRRGLERVEWVVSADDSVGNDKEEKEKAS